MTVLLILSLKRQRVGVVETRSTWILGRVPEAYKSRLVGAGVWMCSVVRMGIFVNRLRNRDRCDNNSSRVF